MSGLSVNIIQLFGGVFMNIGRIDVFENEEEIKHIVGKLQASGLKQMAVPDAFWSPKVHARALKSTHKMGKKVLAKL